MNEVTVVRDHAALQEHVAAWDDLSAHALEANAFYESWVALPALEFLGKGKDLQFVLVYRSDPQRPNAPLLCGLFPLERRRNFKGLPAESLTLWDYGHCYLCTPLIRATHAAECLDAFFDWLASGPGSAPIMEWPQIAGDGPVYQHLVALFRRRSTIALLQDGWARALLRRREDGEAYLQASLSANKRRDLQRKQRRLAEMGSLEFAEPGSRAELEEWLPAMMSLEVEGWKGKEGTALACNEADRSFFTAVARRGFERGRLWMLGLKLNGRLIAVRSNYLSKPGSFFFKPVYDESFSRFSPGVLVETETIRKLHEKEAFAWMDSCTSPDNDLLNTLWLDRRTIVSLVTATGNGSGGALVLSSLPLLRWMKGVVKPLQRWAKSVAKKRS